MLHIWFHASPTKGGAHTDSGKFFQYYWSDQEARKHINWQELRDAKMVLLQLTSPSNIVQLHLDNIMAIALSERWEGPDPQLCARSLLLWHQAI